MLKNTIVLTFNGWREPIIIFSQNLDDEWDYDEWRELFSAAQKMFLMQDPTLNIFGYIAADLCGTQTACSKLRDINDDSIFSTEIADKKFKGKFLLLSDLIGWIEPDRDVERTMMRPVLIMTAEYESHKNWLLDILYSLSKEIPLDIFSDHVYDVVDDTVDEDEDGPIIFNNSMFVLKE